MEEIKNIFNEISKYYDKTNDLISFGLHTLVKKMAIAELNIAPRSMVLDVCCGTGDFTKIIGEQVPNAKVIGIDIAENMLRLAKKKNRFGVFLRMDATNVTFKKFEFAYVISAFGLRNIPNRRQAIAEIYRILKPEGKFMHLDFGYHNKLSKFFDSFVLFITTFLPVNKDAYRYLVESKNKFPEPDKMIEEFENCGFRYIKKKDYLFGLISMQIMRK